MSLKPPSSLQAPLIIACCTLSSAHLQWVLSNPHHEVMLMHQLCRVAQTNNTPYAMSLGLLFHSSDALGATGIACPGCWWSATCTQPWLVPSNHSPCLQVSSLAYHSLREPSVMAAAFPSFSLFPFPRHACWDGGCQPHTCLWLCYCLDLSL